MPNRLTTWCVFCLGAGLAVTASGYSRFEEWARVERARDRGAVSYRIVHADSMTGFVLGGHVVARIVPYASVRPGDRVLFWSYNKPCPTAHIAVRRVMGGWVTRGDRNTRDDAELMTERTFIGLWEVQK